jgi:hypothetical protein
MFRGFKLSVNDGFFKHFKEAGLSHHRDNKPLVDGRLSQSAINRATFSPKK